jgi:hypothetical protein
MDRRSDDALSDRVEVSAQRFVQLGQRTSSAMAFMIRAITVLRRIRDGDFHGPPPYELDVHQLSMATQITPAASSRIARRLSRLPGAHLEGMPVS